MFHFLIVTTFSKADNSTIFVNSEYILQGFKTFVQSRYIRELNIYLISSQWTKKLT